VARARFELRPHLCRERFEAADELLVYLRKLRLGWHRLPEQDPAEEQPAEAGVPDYHPIEVDPEVQAGSTAD